ncbi:DegT/DnrJ/EryC1/StrS family aminotransferase [Actinospongicola halichondriae]|uniref:DegT/DnrJ/EryC1/StrS family aminotransferase n=1 Tax=Actinospongicola halichondriae TaxID=3236844 RepID=UPI003D53CB0E
MSTVRIAKPMIGDEERAAVDRVLSSGSISQGPEVAAFEDEFASLVDGRRCVAVNSGTSALHIALLTLGIGPGDEVIVPSFTFAATANAVCLAGARPVFVDIDPATFCVSPAAVEAAIGPRTAAIMPVHLYGHPADMHRIGRLAVRHGLALIEDAAQAHAAEFDGRPVGSFGHAAVFSFYPTKNMTTGEGGMVVFPDAGSERRARLLRSQGMERMYENEIVGFNLRMTDMAAAIGRVQLGRLAAFTERRETNAAKLTAALADSAAVTPPARDDRARHVFHQYTVRCRDREEVLRRCREANIEARVYYPTPTHQLPSFATDDDLPETIRAADEVVSLPVGPHVEARDLDRIIGALT